MTKPSPDDPRAWPTAPLIGVSAAVFREGRVLVARRGRPPLEGLWSLPGGLVEPGERLAEAAAREVMEETGVAAEIVGLADVVEVIRRDAEGAVERHFVVLCHAARWLSGEGTTSAEASQIAWVKPDQIDGLATTEGLAAAVARAAELLAAAGRAR